MCACLALNVFFFFRQIFGLLYFGGHLGLKRPRIFCEKKKENIRKRLGTGTLNTCKNSGSNSQKRRGQWHLKDFWVSCLNQLVAVTYHVKNAGLVQDELPMGSGGVEVGSGLSSGLGLGPTVLGQGLRYGIALNDLERPVATWVQVLATYWYCLGGVP